MYQRMNDLPGTSGYWKPPPLPQHSSTTVQPPPGWAGYLKHPPVPDPARVHTAMTTALNGWQITLIVVGAALLAAAISLLVLRRAQGIVSANPRDEALVDLGNGRNRGSRGRRGDAASGSHPGRAEVL